MTSVVNKKKKGTAIKLSTGDKIFNTINITLCSLIILIVAYPLYFILIASFSDPMSVMQGQVYLFPKGIGFGAYVKILKYDSVLIGYRVSLILVVVGTIINFIMTLLGAYPLSRKDLWGRNAIMMILSFTMFFSGGLIPTYLVVKGLGLLNTIWAMILPTAITLYNLIVMRTFFQSTIPDSLIEAAYIDGASNMQVLFRVVLPLSSAIIAVICLFYGVAHWNQYFEALIYVRKKELQPLQIALREILLLSQMTDVVESGDFEDQLLEGEQIKYSLIIVASVPALIAYPFIQKHFVKGVMLGAIKA